MKTNPLQLQRLGLFARQRRLSDSKIVRRRLKHYVKSRTSLRFTADPVLARRWTGDLLVRKHLPMLRMVFALNVHIFLSSEAYYFHVVSDTRINYTPMNIKRNYAGSSLRKPSLCVNGSSNLISVFIRSRSITNHEKKESVDTSQRDAGLIREKGGGAGIRVYGHKIRKGGEVGKW